ncbi:hypothetical protein BC628DRAFT_1341761 [Trametes gibbosa]|nr:hypothetical protein BC628DRAFT_1341761 [Trametes gibbosa]
MVTFRCSSLDAKHPSTRRAYLRVTKWDEDPLEFWGLAAVEAAIRDLRKHGAQVWELVAKSLPHSALPELRVLLQCGLPRLEHLGVYVDWPEDRGTEKQPLSSFELPLKKFAALRSLVLVDSAAHLTPPLASRLRCLIMYSDPDRSGLLPLMPFLDCVGCFDCMEEFEVYNCFALTSVKEVGGRQPHKSRLAFMKIEDYPLNIFHMLSAIIVPAHANVVLWANVRGALVRECFDALTGILPDRSCLPILPRVSNVDVYCTPERCYITTRVANLDPMSFLHLELLMDAPDQPTQAFKHDLGELFENMVRHIGDIFSPLQVDDLEFVGDIDHVPFSTWIATFNRFYGLRHLKMDDYERRASPEKLISALMTASPQPYANNAPLCTNLERLVLYGDMPQQELLDLIHVCLKSRKEMGARAILARLELRLYSDKECPAEVENRYRELFSPFAERTVLRIYKPSGDRLGPLSLH